MGSDSAKDAGSPPAGSQHNQRGKKKKKRARRHVEIKGAPPSNAHGPLQEETPCVDSQGSAVVRTSAQSYKDAFADYPSTGTMPPPGAEADDAPADTFKNLHSSSTKAAVRVGPTQSSSPAPSSSSSEHRPQSTLASSDSATSSVISTTTLSLSSLLMRPDDHETQKKRYQAFLDDQLGTLLDDRGNQHRRGGKITDLNNLIRTGCVADTLHDVVNNLLNTNEQFDAWAKVFPDSKHPQAITLQASNIPNLLKVTLIPSAKKTSSQLRQNFSVGAQRLGKRWSQPKQAETQSSENHLQNASRLMTKWSALTAKANGVTRSFGESLLKVADKTTLDPSSTDRRLRKLLENPHTQKPDTVTTEWINHCVDNMIRHHLSEQHAFPETLGWILNQATKVKCPDNNPAGHSLAVFNKITGAVGEYFKANPLETMKPIYTAWLNDLAALHPEQLQAMQYAHIDWPVLQEISDDDTNRKLMFKTQFFAAQKTATANIQERTKQEAAEEKRREEEAARQAEETAAYQRKIDGRFTEIENEEREKRQNDMQQCSDDATKKPAQQGRGDLDTTSSPQTIASQLVTTIVAQGVKQAKWYIDRKKEMQSELKSLTAAKPANIMIQKFKEKQAEKEHLAAEQEAREKEEQAVKARQAEEKKRLGEEAARKTQEALDRSEAATLKAKPLTSIESLLKDDRWKDDLNKFYSDSAWPTQNAFLENAPIAQIEINEQPIENILKTLLIAYVTLRDATTPDEANSKIQSTKNNITQAATKWEKEHRSEDRWQCVLNWLTFILTCFIVTHCTDQPYYSETAGKIRKDVAAWDNETPTAH